MSIESLGRWAWLNRQIKSILIEPRDNGHWWLIWRVGEGDDQLLGQGETVERALNAAAKNDPDD